MIVGRSGVLQWACPACPRQRTKQVGRIGCMCITINITITIIIIIIISSSTTTATATATTIATTTGVQQGCHQVFAQLTGMLVES